MAGDKDRILVIAFVADEGDDTVLATSVTYYRDRQHLADADGLPLKASFSAASGTVHEITLGEIIPPPSHIRLVPTFQA